MLPPKTANPGESVWDVVGRVQFDDDVSALMRHNQATGTIKNYSLDELRLHSGQSDLISLPIDIECQLADDIAFVAAFEEGVRTVTAATVETLPDGLRVVLAANEGVQSQVIDAFKDVFDLLKACAELRKSSDSKLNSDSR